MSEHAQGAEKITLLYNNASKAKVTNAKGKLTHYHFDSINSVPRVTEVEGFPSDNCVGANAFYSYDADGRRESKTDWNGVQTTYAYNDRGLEISRTGAVNTADERTIETQWYEDFRLATKIIQPGLTTEYLYDADGRIKQQKETDTTNIIDPYPTFGRTRITNYTYTEFPNGVLKTMMVDGPRTNVIDVTVFDYMHLTNLVAKLMIGLVKIVKVVSIGSFLKI